MDNLWIIWTQVEFMNHRISQKMENFCLWSMESSNTVMLGDGVEVPGM